MTEVLEKEIESLKSELSICKARLQEFESKVDAKVFLMSWTSDQDKVLREAATEGHAWVHLSKTWSKRLVDAGLPDVPRSAKALRMRATALKRAETKQAEPTKASQKRKSDGDHDFRPAKRARTTSPVEKEEPSGIFALATAFMDWQEHNNRMAELQQQQR